MTCMVKEELAYPMLSVHTSEVPAKQTIRDYSSLIRQLTSVFKKESRFVRAVRDIVSYQGSTAAMSSQNPISITIRIGRRLFEIIPQT